MPAKKNLYCEKYFCLFALLAISSNHHIHAWRWCVRPLDFVPKTVPAGSLGGRAGHITLYTSENGGECTVSEGCGARSSFAFKSRARLHIDYIILYTCTTCRRVCVHGRARAFAEDERSRRARWTVLFRPENVVLQDRGEYIILITPVQYILCPDANTMIF